MLLKIISPREVKSIMDAVKLIELVRAACNKYGIVMSDVEIQVKVEQNIKKFCTLPLKKGEQLYLDI